MLRQSGSLLGTVNNETSATPVIRVDKDGQRAIELRFGNTVVCVSFAASLALSAQLADAAKEHVLDITNLA